MSKRVLFRGAAKSAAIRVAATLVVFGLNVLLARSMTLADYGIYNFLIASISLLALLVQCGLDKAAIKVIPQAQSEEHPWDIARFTSFGSRVVLLMSLIIAALLCGIGLVGYPGSELRAYFVPGLILLPALGLLQYWQQCLRGLKKIIASQLFEQVLLPFAIALAVLYLLATAQDVTATRVVWLHALILVVLTVVVGMLLRTAVFRVGSDAPATASSKNEYGVWVSLALPLGLAGLLSYGLARGELILLGIFLSPEDVAQYSVVLRITNLTVFGLTAANAIAGPMFSQYFHANNQEQLQKAVSQSVLFATLISVPLFLALFFTPRLVLGVFGEEYLVSVGLLLVLSVGQLFNVLTGPVGPLLTVTGQQWFYLRVLGIVAALKLVAIVPAALVFGVEGVAVVAALSRAAWCVWLAVGAYQKIGVFPVLFGSVFLKAGR